MSPATAAVLFNPLFLSHPKRFRRSHSDHPGEACGLLFGDWRLGHSTEGFAIRLGGAA